MAGNEIYGSMAENARLSNAANIDYIQAIKDGTLQQDTAREGKDKAAKAMVDLTKDQRDITQSAEHVINKGIPVVVKGLSGLAGVTQQLTGVLGEIAGKQGQVGGGTTLLNKTGITGGGAPTVSPITPPAGAGSANIDSLINFSGGTGDKTHFQQLNPTVLNNFVQMASSYFSNTGKKLQVNSAFRSMEEQAKVNSGGNPRAAPGKSLHNVGKAVDINSSQVSELQSSGLLGQYGFSPLNGDPPHIQMPSAATGGILSGPMGGYQAMLHGNEAVVPLPDGKTIPLQNKNNGGSPQQTALLTMELEKLDSMLRVMQKQNDITNKILAKQS